MKSLFFLSRVCWIWRNNEWFIQEHFFSFLIGDVMFMPIFVLITFVPMEACKPIWQLHVCMIDVHVSSVNRNKWVF